MGAPDPLDATLSPGGTLQAPAQPAAQQLPDVPGMVGDPGHLLDHRSDAGQGPVVGVEAMRAGALSERLAASSPRPVSGKRTNVTRRRRRQGSVSAPLRPGSMSSTDRHAPPIAEVDATQSTNASCPAVGSRRRGRLGGAGQRVRGVLPGVLWAAAQASRPDDHRPCRRRGCAAGGLCPRRPPLAAAGDLRRAGGVGAARRDEPCRRHDPPPSPTRGRHAAAWAATNPAGTVGRHRGPDPSVACAAAWPTPSDRLHHLVGLPVEEIGRQLGVPSGTVKGRLARGRAALARRLGTDFYPTHQETLVDE